MGHKRRTEKYTYFNARGKRYYITKDLSESQSEEDLNVKVDRETCESEEEPLVTIEEGSTSTIGPALHLGPLSRFYRRACADKSYRR